MIEATRIYDKELIKSIVTKPEIWKTVAEDGQKEEEFEPKVEDECWLAMTNGDVVVGLYNLHVKNCITVQIHPFVLPEYRSEHAKETGKEALRWIFKNTIYNKVITETPVIYKNIKIFACSLGFKEEGINRKSCLKDGEIIDQWNLGITREEIGELLYEGGYSNIWRN